MTSNIIRILPESVQKLPVLGNLTDAEELRFRIGQPVSVLQRGREVRLGGYPVTSGDLTHILSAASNCSIYAVNETLKDGFLMLPGGHRIGICGTAVIKNGMVGTIHNLSSLSIRVARQRIGIGIAPGDSCLIIGPPGSGKTTLLRDCVRVLSDEMGKRISLVDERSEVAACVSGVPQLSVGGRTDILTGCPKDIGIMMLLRTMNPEWIAVDEITKQEDIDAVCQASYCGVKLLATAHAGSVDDLDRRPVYRQLISMEIFRELLILGPGHGISKGRIGER